MTDNPDHRREARQRVARAAVTVVENAAATTASLPCVVLDISPTGARLHVHNPSEMPDRFHLVVESENARHLCEVVWRRDNEIGVRFVD